jgi:hypothetical protein
MNIEEKYQDDYILLAGLREYIENGTMLAAVNFWRDSAQNFKEFDAIKHRENLLMSNPEYRNCEFLVAFVKEKFPEIEDEIPENIIEIVLPIIEQKEGKETLKLTEQFLIEYATYIAKSSKEDWLAFVGLKDSISAQEKKFIEKLSGHFDFDHKK